ncbi:MAG: haloacid dehalogenase-like hydrolase, partial [Leptospirales bacterium]
MPLEQAGWDAPAYELLTRKILAGPPGLAAFDFDNTLIRNDLGEAVMYYIMF